MVHAPGTGDLRLVMEITWGGHQALRAEYAMVFAGRRARDGDPVFLTTAPGRAAAVARRYARQRRARPFLSPDQLDFRRGRNFSLTVTGAYTATWAAGRGAPGEPGCGFVSESGSNKTTFRLAGNSSRIRGTSDRSYTAATECAPTPKLGPPGGFLCPARSALGGQGTAEFLNKGSVMWTGRRARGPRLFLRLDLDLGESCPGWEGIFSNPALFLDGSAAGVLRLRVGGRKTLRLTQRGSCVEQVAGTQGDATACTLTATANVVVRSLASRAALIVVAAVVLGSAGRASDYGPSEISFLLALGAPWVLVSAAVGAATRSLRDGALTGAAALGLSVVVYYAIRYGVEHRASQQYALSMTALWGGLALACGALFGAAGAAWRAGGARRAAAASLLGGALAGEALLFLALGREQRPVLFAELAAGALCTLALPGRESRRVVVAAATAIAFAALLADGALRTFARLNGWGG